MTWFKDIFERAKRTIGNTYESVKNTFDNWSKGFYSAPGRYKYCGPGNPVENGEPANASDAACRQHDIDYENFKRQNVQGKELRDLVRESDDRLIANLQKAPDRDVGSYLSEYGIRAKKRLEDWGLLSPDRFIS